MRPQDRVRGRVRDRLGTHPAHLAVFLALGALLSLFLGRYPHPGFLPIRSLFDDPMALHLLLDLRLPRILAGILLGASLGGAGAVFQMVFSNPLVEPGFLGVSQGAAFGAALVIVAVAGRPALVQAGAMLFALAGLAASWALARAIRYGGWVLRLVLAGIAVSAFFSAGLGVLKILASPLSGLPEITFWLLGGLWSVSWRDVLWILPPAGLGLAAVFLLRWRLDVLSLDDRVAHSLGGAPRRERILVLSAVTLAVAAAVSVSGLVGWVGLLAPHAARRLCGTGSRRSLPASMLLGAAAVVVCDDAARTLLPAEIPLGILTAAAGAAGFLVLMIRRPRERGG